MPTKDEQKEQQRRQWGANAASWDAQHERLEKEMAAVSEWLCREAGLQPGMRVLDMACGSGHPAIDVARLVSPGGSVVATDFAAKMVEATRRRVAAAGLDNAEVQIMDLEEIDYSDESFDAATCRFGLMFCPQPEKAVAEVRRVLKPGGRFVLSVWDEPGESPGQTVLGEAMRRISLPPAPVDFDAPGVYQLAPPGKLQRLLEDAGYRSVRVEPLPQEAVYESFDALWGRAMARPGAQRAEIEAMSAAETQRLKDALAEVAQPYTSDGVIRLRMTPLCAVATK
ncbi:MAG TPA: methyltransferase domain-containing protein [Dehalococcoidia bacterium]|nr:methyltransferase domain-containing protein [Dehalococcoidia bacterium]